MNELKHSIKIHLLLFGGPTKTLATHLLKTIDLIEDEDKARKEFEAAEMSLSLIMNIAGLLVNITANHIKWYKQGAFNMIRPHAEAAHCSSETRLSSYSVHCDTNERVEELEKAYDFLSRIYNKANRSSKIIRCTSSGCLETMATTKQEILAGVASVLDKTSSLTGAIYPTIFSIDHVKLNNRDITQEELESKKDHVIAPFRTEDIVTHASNLTLTFEH